jgi:hypothetical protein
MEDAFLNKLFIPIVHLKLGKTQLKPQNNIIGYLFEIELFAAALTYAGYYRNA